MVQVYILWFDQYNEWKQNRKYIARYIWKRQMAGGMKQKYILDLERDDQGLDNYYGIKVLDHRK